jgi:hypothetical protein
MIPGPGDITERVRIPDSVINESYQDANALRVIADGIDTVLDDMPELHCNCDKALVERVKERLLSMARDLRGRAQEIEDDNA